MSIKILKSLCAQFFCVLHYIILKSYMFKERIYLVEKDETTYFEGALLCSVFKKHFTPSDYPIPHLHLFIFNKKAA